MSKRVATLSGSDLSLIMPGICSGPIQQHGIQMIRNIDTERPDYQFFRHLMALPLLRSLVVRVSSYYFTSDSDQLVSETWTDIKISNLFWMKDLLKLRG